MSVPARLAAYAAVLGLVFGGAALAGATINPTDEAVMADTGHGAAGPNAAGGAGPDARHGGAESAARPAAEDGGHTAGDSGGVGAAVSGLAVSEGGYTLQLDRGFFTAGETAPLTFRITDERGRVVRDDFELEHDKQLHLIVVRRDTAIFEHLHPRKGVDGRWSVDLNLREPGVYRAYADFKLDGKRRTLASDLFVPGDFRPNRSPEPNVTDETFDATGKPAGDLDVALKATGVRAGREKPLTFAVTRDGQPFDALQPYLGAKGHLVALREGDLAYLHVHPTEAGSEHGSTSTGARGNEITFAATFPTAARYRLFLQFQTGGQIRTVAYTLEVPR